MGEDNLVKVAWRLQVLGRTLVMGQRFRWRDGVEMELKQLNLRVEDAEDGSCWQKLIKMISVGKVLLT